jgi:hypothetical protein
MTKTEAQQAARLFMANFVNADRQWDVAAVDGCLPAGYRLKDGASEEDFMPPTVATVSAAIRRLAVPSVQ